MPLPAGLAAEATMPGGIHERLIDSSCQTLYHRDKPGGGNEVLGRRYACPRLARGNVSKTLGALVLPSTLPVDSDARASHAKEDIQSVWFCTGFACQGHATPQPRVERRLRSNRKRHPGYTGRENNDPEWVGQFPRIVALLQSA